MTNPEQYQSAMNKITPSEAWKQDTLAKMRWLQKEQQAAPSLEKTPAGQKLALRVSRRVWAPLAAAAAFALVLVPLAISHEGGSKSGLFVGPPAPREAAMQQEAQGEAAAAAEDRSLEDGTQNYAGSPAVAQEYSSGELPRITWGGDTAGLGGEITLLARRPEELADANPTRDLAPEELPECLPVWYAPCGPEYGALLERPMQHLADYLGLELLTEKPEPAPVGYPAPDCWPDQAYGSLMRPGYDPSLTAKEQEEHQVWEVNVDQQYVTLRARTEEKKKSLGQTTASPELDAFGPFVGLEHPMHQSGFYTTVHGEQHPEWFLTFYYEQSPKGTPVAQQLLDYSFKRIYDANVKNGQLDVVRFRLPPQSPMAGEYPLRSLEDARADALENAARKKQKGLIDYALTEQDVVSWRLEYQSGSMDPWIQPVYVFTFRTPLTAEQAHYDFAGMEEYQVYTEYRVSALIPEYSIP